MTNKWTIQSLGMRPDNPRARKIEEVFNTYYPFDQKHIDDTGYCKIMVIPDEAYEQMRLLGKEFGIPKHVADYKSTIYKIIQSESDWKAWLDAKAAWLNGTYQGGSKKQKQKQKQKRKQYGVYGIYKDQQLIYIGMTMRDFETRWNEHKSFLQNKATAPENMLLYSDNLKVEQLEFKILFDASTVQTNKELKRRDIEAIELGYITMFQPKYNYTGVLKPYQFS